MLLGDMGADVIKIEPSDGGDQTRARHGLQDEGQRQPRVLQPQPQQAELRAQSQEQARAARCSTSWSKTSDILLENYRPGVTKRLGIDYETLKKINPRLIYASISGFGQTGPWSQRPGFDLIAQAMAGTMSITGHPGGPPTKSGVPVSDIGCALFVVYGIMSAYIGREKTGRGQYVDGSLFEAAIAFSIWDISEYWGTGKRAETARHRQPVQRAVPGGEGERHYFVMGANSNKLFQQLCEMLGRPELFSDARFAYGLGAAGQPARC